MLKLELSPNLEYLITLPGFGKLLTVIFGIIVVGLGGHSQEMNIELWKEQIFLSITSGCFIISCLYLIALCFSDQLVCSKINRIIDFSYHAGAGILEITAGSLMMNSVVELKATDCKYYNPSQDCKHHEEKIGAAIFAILCGLVYIFTAALIQRVRSL